MDIETKKISRRTYVHKIVSETVKGKVIRKGDISFTLNHKERSKCKFNLKYGATRVYGK